MGQLSLQSSVALPKGGALVLQLLSHSPSVQFQISSLNGAAPPLSMKTGKLTPGAAQTQNLAATGVSSSSKMATGASASAPKLTPGNVLQATLMRPLSQPSSGRALQTPGSLTSPATAPAAVAKGAPVNTGGLPPASATKGPTPTLPGTGNPALQAAAKTPGNIINPNIAKATPGGVSQTSGYLPTGSQLSVKITGVQLPNPIATSSTPSQGTTGSGTGLAAGTPLSGTVTGSTPSGHPIVQTRVGVFSLTTQTVVPRGSEVTLEVVTAPTAPTVKPGTIPSLHQSMFASRKWPALEEVFQVLQEANPATAQQIMNSVVPRPNTALTAGILFFMTALRVGDFRTLIGDDVMKLLEKTRPNLMGKVSDDFSSLARMADEPVSSDWRVALIPINTGAEIDQIRMLLRQHANDEEDEESGKSDTRFVIDVELSKFGRVQLDGLVRNKGKSLDLIVRSESPFASNMQNDIRTIFEDATSLTGLKGSVSFQAAPPDFIDIADPTGDHDLGLVV